MEFRNGKLVVRDCDWFDWRKKMKKELFEYLDRLYERNPFDEMSIDITPYSIYDSHERIPRYVEIRKDRELIAKIHVFELLKSKSIADNPTFYKRTRMFVEWVEKRKVNVDISRIPIGISECVFCGEKVQIFPDKKPVCKYCYEAYKKGKEELNRIAKFEKIHWEIGGDSPIYTNNPEYIPFIPFKEFLRRYVPDRLFNQGAEESLKILKKISDIAYEVHFLEGVIKGKSLLQGLNNGEISLNDFSQPEKEYQEKYRELIDLMNKFYKREEKNEG